MTDTPPTREEITRVKAKADAGQPLGAADLSVITRAFGSLLERLEQLEAAEHNRQRMALSARRAKARDGWFVGGLRPFGLVWNAERSVWERVPDEVTVLLDIKHRHDQGESLSAIARSLNGAGVPTPKGGVKWYPSSVKKLLENPIYHQHFTWGAAIASGLKAADATAATGIFGERGG